MTRSHGASAPLAMGQRKSRRSYCGIAALGSIAITLIALPAAIDFPLHLIWNVTSSSPVGLYLIDRPAKARKGDWVAAWPPAGARELAAERRYLPSNVPLIKRVAGAYGDEICAHGSRILVNGLPAAERFSVDRRGRPLPRWEGCRRLGRHEFFLLSVHRLSFDGRYFGTTPKALLIGRARLLWP